MNKSLAKFLICSTVTLTGAMGLWLGISRSTLGQNIVAQELESDSSNSSLAEAEKLNQQVIQLYQQGKYNEAIPLAEKALAIRRKQLGENHPSTATSLSNLAELYRAQGKYSEAEPLFQQALAILQKQLGENHPDTTNSRSNLARLYLSQGKYSEAEALLRQALAIRRKQLGENHPDTAIFLNNLASLYLAQGKYGEAEPLLRKALAIFQKQLGENHPSTAQSLNNLAALYLAQGKYGEAEPLYKKALSIRRKQLGENHPDTADSLNNLAGLYKSQGRYSEAEPLLRQALAIRRKQLGDNHPDTAIAFDNLAGLYESQGRYSEAELFYQRALAIFQKQLGDNYPDTTIALSNLAGLYRAQGKYGEAEPLYKQALAVRRKQLGDNHSDTAIAFDNLAGLYVLQERYSEAEPFLRQALAIFQKQLGNHPDTAISLNNLAELYKSQGRYSEAEPFLRQALAIFQKQLGENHPSTASSLNNLAKLYQSQGNINRAIELLAQGVKVEEYNLSENLVAGSEQQKRDYIATIFDTTNVAISLNLKSASSNPDATKLALTTILQRKGRILDVLTNSLQILRQQTNDPKTQDLLTQLITLRTQYSNFVFQKPEDIQSPKIHRQQLIELETQTKQLEDQLSRRSAKFRNLSKPVTLETIQQLIPANSALVELVRYQPFNPQAAIGKQKQWGEPHYAAYILRSQGQPQAIDLGKAEPIEQAVDQFRQDLCTTSKTEKDTQYCLDNLPIAQVKSSAQSLEQMVIQPVRQALGKTTNILLSPDGKLNLVPFEALVDRQNKYLVKNYNFTYLTSGRDLIRLQQKSPSQEQPLVMADPLYNREANLAASKLPQRSIEDISQLFGSKSFSRLKATEKEAQAIQSLLNLPGERVKLQSQASETELKQVQSPQLLHIATHGFFLDRSSATNPNQASPNRFNNLNNLDKPITFDNPLFRSGLVLAGVESRPSQVKSENDGVLTAYEASFLDLVGTKLVVLSACDTGVGDITTGEGIYGLRRALVIAGSQSQLISLWKVEDNGTKDLMTAYYQTLKQGEGRITALHEVQRQMLRGELKGEKGQSYEHPYYWASFIPSGDWTSMKLNLSQ